MNPASVVPGAAGQSVPVENPFVHPIDVAATDPRTPGGAVPGAVKWLNDTLDGIECLSVSLPHSPLAPTVAATHVLNVQDLRSKTAILATRILALGNPAFTKERPGSPTKIVEKHADEWSASESDALAHVTHTLDIFRIGFADATSNTNGAHAEVTIRGRAVDVLAVRGATHEQNLKHAEKHRPYQRRQLLIVSRDSHNSPLSSRDGTIFRNKQAGIQSRAKFTDPANNRFPIGFQELMQEFLGADTPVELEVAVYARLAN